MVTNINFRQELNHSLQQWFPDCQTELDINPMSDKVSGFVIWDGFSDMSPRERQRVLWNHLRELPRDEQLMVSAIFTVTAEELQSMRDDD